MPLTRHAVPSLAALTLLLLPLGARAQSPYDRLVVFGDSLSDTGNAYSVTSALHQVLPSITPTPASPPYYNGRFSDGPIWVEDLAQQLGVNFDTTPMQLVNPATLQVKVTGDDIALGGATTGTANFGTPINVAAGMQTEVAAYLTQEKVDPHALYILWGGANDYFSAASSNPTADAATRQQTVNTTVSNLTGEIGALANAGAKNFLIPNLPDLGTTPFAASNNLMTPLSEYTATHDADLAAALGALSANPAYAGDTFQLLDVNGLYNSVEADPTAYGFEFTTGQGMDNLGPNQDKYLFWDYFHPTAPGHRLLAGLAYRTVTPAAVPEPNTFALLGAGLALVGFARRRKRTV